MHARTIVAYLVPGKADEAIRIFRERVVPEVRKQPSQCECGSTTWPSEAWTTTNPCPLRASW